MIAGLIDLAYQSGTYEAFAGVLANKGNGIYFKGTEEERPNFEGNRDNIGEQGILENKIGGNRGTNQFISEEQGNMYPPPEKASHIN